MHIVLKEPELEVQTRRRTITWYSLIFILFDVVAAMIDSDNKMKLFYLVELVCLTAARSLCKKDFRCSVFGFISLYVISIIENECLRGHILSCPHTHGSCVTELIQLHPRHCREKGHLITLGFNSDIWHWQSCDYHHYGELSKKFVEHFSFWFLQKKMKEEEKYSCLSRLWHKSFALLAHHEALLLNMAKESSGISLSNVKALPEEIKGQLSYVEG